MAHGQWTEVEARGVLEGWMKSGKSVERYARARGLVPQCVFRPHLGTRSDMTWARIPAALGHGFRSTWAAVPTHLGADSGVLGQRAARG